MSILCKMKFMNKSINNNIKYYWKLLYDGECPLCTRFAAELQRYDVYKQIDIIPLQSYMGIDKAIDIVELQKDVHMLGQNGECLVGSEVIREVLMIVPQMKAFRWMLKTNAGKGLSKALYSSLKFVRNCRHCNKKKEIRTY